MSFLCKIINASRLSAQTYTSPKSSLTDRFSSQTKGFLNQGVSDQEEAVSHFKQRTKKKLTSSKKKIQNVDISDQNHFSDQVSTAQKLNILNSVLDEVQAQPKQNRLDEEVQGNLNQADSQSQNMPAINNPGQSQNQTSQDRTTGLSQIEDPPQEELVSGARKEGLEGGRVSVEAASSMQYVEQESSPEIPPEVEKYIKKVEDKKVRAPQEIVVADQAGHVQNDQKYVSEPVVVLPITPELEAQGQKKSPKFSVRWLVEWSQKIIKMFAGRAIYRQPADQ